MKRLLMRQKTIKSRSLALAICALGLIGSIHPTRAQETPRPATGVDMMRLLMLSQLEAGAVTGEQVWQNEAISLEEAAARLEHQDLFKDAEKMALREGLFEILLAHGQAWWQPAGVPLVASTDAREAKPDATLSAELRLVIADKLHEKKDARALPLYLQVLREALADPKTRSLNEISPILHLARYYASTGDLRTAVQTILAGEKYSSTPYWHDAVRIEAARLYLRMGENQKAAALYREVKKSGSGWLNGMTRWDIANVLASQGQYREALVTLDQPMQNEDPRMQVGTYALQAQCLYNLGRLDDARQVCDEVGRITKTMTAHQQRGGVKEQAEQAHQLLQRIKATEAALKGVSSPYDIVLKTVN